MKCHLDIHYIKPPPNKDRKSHFSPSDGFNGDISAADATLRYRHSQVSAALKFNNLLISAIMSA